MLKQLKISSFCLIFALISVRAVSQNFKYKEVEKPYIKFIVPSDIDAFVNVEDYLPHNYVKDGSIDYKKYIQKAINENNNIRLPNFPVNIGTDGIYLKDNSRVFFDKKTKLILAPNSNTHYGIITLKKISNVIIYNPTLIGDRYEHLSEKGQWGMGINIYDSQDIKIFNSNISNTWGDGIYITSYTKNEESENILIKYGVIDNVRRNGVSIISVKNLLIDSLQISNVNGHKPASGIDIEPNVETNTIKNIELNSILTLNNELDGIVISLNNLINSKIKNEVTISIKNHKDIGSRLGLNIHKLKNVEQNDYQLNGLISIEGASWLDTKSKNTFMIRPETSKLPELRLRNLKTNNMSQIDFDKHIEKFIKHKNHFHYLKTK